MGDEWGKCTLTPERAARAPIAATAVKTIIAAGDVAQYDATDRIEFATGFLASSGSTTTCKATNEIRLTASASGNTVLTAGCEFRTQIEAVSLKASANPRPPQRTQAAAATLEFAPNPFNPTTTIRYTLPAAARVRLVVYNSAGRVLRTLVNGTRPAGPHSVVFDGTAVPSGVYYCVLASEGKRLTGRMTLVK